jgi:hypothetical protein
MKIPFLARLLIVILLTVALAEVAPEFVNIVLALILVGIVLGHWKSFSGLASMLGSLGK